MTREANVHFLHACLLLPLTEKEIGLLRGIAHAYAMGNGDYPEATQEEVVALFLKCQEMMGVSPSHV